MSKQSNFEAEKLSRVNLVKSVLTRDIGGLGIPRSYCGECDCRDRIVGYEGKSSMCSTILRDTMKWILAFHINNRRLWAHKMCMVLMGR